MDEIEQLKQLEEQAKTMIKDLEPFQDQASQIVESIKSLQTGIQKVSDEVGPIGVNLTAQAKEIEAGIIPVYELVSAKLEEIKGLQVTAQEELQKISQLKAQTEEYYQNEFVPIKEIIDNPDTGLEKAYQNAQDSLNKIQELQSEIEETKKQIEQLAASGKEINDNNLTLKESLDGMLGVATDKSLSNGFCEIKESLQKRGVLWLRAFFVIFVGAIITTAFSIYSYDEISSNSSKNTQTSATGNITTYNSLTDKNKMEWEMISFWLIRLSIVFPLLFVAYLCFKEYSILRKRIEHYEFKIATAGSMQSYIDILKSRFLGDLDHETEMELKNHILQFIIESMSGIYKEPLPENVAQLELKAKIKEYEVELKVGAKNKKNESKEEQ